MAPDPFTPELPDDGAGPVRGAEAAGAAPVDGEPTFRQAIEAGRRRGGAAGAVLAGAMVAMRDVLEGKPKDEIPIEVEASGEPHDLDRDGVNLAMGHVDVAAPPLERRDPLPAPRRRRR